MRTTARAQRLSTGWSRFKTVGDADPITIAVQKSTGRFGIVGAEDGTIIFDAPTLAEVEVKIKEIQSADTIEVLHAHEPFGDQVVQVRRVKVRRTAHEWVYADGSRIGYRGELYLPTPGIEDAIARKHAEYLALNEALVRCRREGWDLVSALTPLPKSYDAARALIAAQQEP